MLLSIPAPVRVYGDYTLLWPALEQVAVRIGFVRGGVYQQAVSLAAGADNVWAAVR